MTFDLIPTTSQPSELFLTAMKDALIHIRRYHGVIKSLHGRPSEEIYLALWVKSDSSGEFRNFYLAMEERSIPQLQWDEYNPLLNKAISRILASPMLCQVSYAVRSV